MRKTIHASEKRILGKYNRRMIIACLPGAAALVSILIIVLLFYVISPDGVSIPSVLNQVIIYGTYFCVAYLFIVCLIGSIVSDILLKAHREHTYIEINDSSLIVSQHSQTVFTDGKRQSYKKLWVVNLKNVEYVEYAKHTVIIGAPARFFHENADWLHYESTPDGIDFDNWWYNSNGGKNVSTVEVADFYAHTERIAGRIQFCSDKIIAREARREQFRRQMLDIAKNTKHKRGISDKYVPPKRRKFR